MTQKVFRNQSDGKYALGRIDDSTLNIATGPRWRRLYDDDAPAPKKIMTTTLFKNII